MVIDMRLNEQYLKSVVKDAVRHVLNEGWDGDRFTYDNLSDKGNGGIEEYGMNISNLLNGLGGDPDSLHAVGETVGENMDKESLKCFIEGLIVAYKTGKNGNYRDTYNNYGIERN